MFFLTDELNQLLIPQSIKIVVLNRLINELNFEESERLIAQIIDNLSDQEEKYKELSEDVLNEFFVYKILLSFYQKYHSLWMNIYIGEFSKSWNNLQDCLDFLRLIKKFCEFPSHPNLLFFESQLIEIEKLFRHEIFFSPGMIVEEFRCSICNEDIDGPQCQHLVGQLYRGQIAQRVFGKIKGVDHAAIVENPADKRCVIQYENDSNFFQLVRYVSELLREGSLAPNSAFTSVFTKKRNRNISFIKQPRNSKCQCGSGKKFKKCCAKHEFIEQDHFAIVSGKKFKLFDW